MAQVLPPSNALSFLKADLGFFSASIPADLESYLAGLIMKARQDIIEMKIEISAGFAPDDQFVAAYAAWLYRNKTGQARPESLSREIKNRQVNRVLSEKN